MASKERNVEKLFIDSNIFNFLFVSRIDLRNEFPETHFELLIVAEQDFENRAIPEKKADLKDFIYTSMNVWNVKTDRLFGFYDDRHLSDEQRIGGFTGVIGDAGGAGRFACLAESNFIKDERKENEQNKRIKTGLYPDETDISLGARAMAGSIVLTNDAKAGPLPRAYAQGGRVVFIVDYDSEVETFHDFVMRRAKRNPTDTPVQ